MINYIMESGGQPGLSEFVDVRPCTGTFTESEHWQLHDQFHGAGAMAGHSASWSSSYLLLQPRPKDHDTDAEIVGILLRLFRGLVLIETSLPSRYRWGVCCVGKHLRTGRNL
jgi:hypothetical protein